MGKLINYLTMLLFIDLFFIATGQICNSDVGCSLNSIIFNSILDINNIATTQFFKELIGNVLDFITSGLGIASLIVGTAVTVGSAFFAPGDLRFFVPIALTLSLITADFVFILTFLISKNAVLGSFIMIPIITIYVMTIVEWLKNKD